MPRKNGRLNPIDLQAKRWVFCDNCEMQETCKKLDYKIGERDLIPATWYGLEAIEILTNKNVFGDPNFDKNMPNIVYESVVLLQEYKIELDKKRLKDGK